MSSSLLRRETSAIISTCARVATGDLLRMKRISRKKDLIAKRSDATASHSERQNRWRSRSQCTASTARSARTVKSIGSPQTRYASSLLTFVGVPCWTATTSGRPTGQTDRPNHEYLGRRQGCRARVVTFVCPTDLRSCYRGAETGVTSRGGGRCSHGWRL